MCAQMLCLLVAIPHHALPTAHATDREGGTGLPCVVSDEGGPSGLVKHGLTGFVTRGGDCGDFAEQTIRLIGDQDLRIAMGRNGYASVKGMDWKSAAAQFFSEVVS